MLDGDPAIALEHLDRIHVPEARDAYRYLVGHAATLRGWSARAEWHGHVPSFRYYRGDEWPYAFIPNQKHLVWYFRRDGLRHPAADVARLQGAFAHVAASAKSELTVRIETLADAVCIAQLVFAVTGDSGIHRRATR
jgi:hypothetical protein